MRLIEENYIPNSQMEKIFIERTRYHQYLVKRNLLLMIGYLNLSKNSLLAIAHQHDESKFKEPERSAYIWMNWQFYCKKHHINYDFPHEINAIIEQGHQHHLSHNAHHPESHPNINKMSLLNIVEMVCDWTAISQETSINQGSCLPWALEEIHKRWHFSCAMKTIIFSTIRELDKRIRDVPSKDTSKTKVR